MITANNFNYAVVILISFINEYVVKKDLQILERKRYSKKEQIIPNTIKEI